MPPISLKSTLFNSLYITINNNKTESVIEKQNDVDKTQKRLWLTFQCGYKAGGGKGHVGLFGDGGDDGGAADACGFEFGYLFESDAAEGEYGDSQTGRVYNVAQPARADGRAGKRVGCGREYRRVSDEVRAVPLRGGSFGGVMSGVADYGASA